MSSRPLNVHFLVLEAPAYKRHAHQAPELRRRSQTIGLCRAVMQMLVSPVAFPSTPPCRPSTFVPSLCVSGCCGPASRAADPQQTPYWPALFAFQPLSTQPHLHLTTECKSPSMVGGSGTLGVLRAAVPDTCDPGAISIALRGSLHRARTGPAGGRSGLATSAATPAPIASSQPSHPQSSAPLDPCPRTAS